MGTQTRTATVISVCHDARITQKRIASNVWPRGLGEAVVGDLLRAMPAKE